MLTKKLFFDTNNCRSLFLTLLKGFFFLLLTTSNSLLPAQNYKFEHLTIADGLPENSAFSMIQDHLGFLWIGTQKGLVRYDGHDMVVYQPDSKDSTSLYGKHVTALHEDRLGNLWVGTLEGLNYFDRANESFTLYDFVLKDSTKFSSKKIVLIHEDKKGNVWVIRRAGGSSGLLHKLDKKTGAFRQYFQESENSIPDNLIYFLWNKFAAPNLSVFRVAPPFYEDSKGTIWMGTYGGGLKRYNTQTDSFIPYVHEPDNPNSISNDSIVSIFEDKAGQLWIGTVNGINSLDKDRKQFTRYQHDPDNIHSLASNLARVVWEDKRGLLWVSTSKGTDRLDPKTGQFTHFLHGSKYKNSLRFQLSFPIHEEENGTLWLLSFRPGRNIVNLHRYTPSTNTFIRFKAQSNAKEGIERGISLISHFVDRTGILYLGSWRGGLNSLDLSSRKFDAYYPEEGLNFLSFKPDQLTLKTAAKKSIKLRNELLVAVDQHGLLWVKDINKNTKLACLETALKDSNGFWWASVPGIGALLRLDFSSQEYTRFFVDPNDENSLYNNEIYQIIEDTNHQIWMVSSWGGGLNRFISLKEGFKRYNNKGDTSTLINDSVITLIEDKQGLFWLATDGHGISTFDPQTEKSNLVSKEYTVNWTLYEDSQQRFWAGTFADGLVQIDKSNGNILKQYTTKDGLSNNSVHAIIEDNNGNLWIRTEHGLSKFNPETETFKNFYEEDGLNVNWTNDIRLFHKSPSGEFFIQMGYGKPLNRFFPEKVIDDLFPPQIVFTDFQIMNNDQEEELQSPLKQDITVTNEIELSHFQNDVTFTFRALHYSRPEENTYAYKLEPYDTKWRYVGTNNTASYTNIDPGDYTFRVKAANYDGVWNEEGISMQLMINPPWWQTNLAYTIFVLAFLGLLYSLYRFQLNRRLAAAETSRLKELDSFKTKLYTNITHEFRTPLTVILGMVEQIKKKPEEAAKLIKRNGQNLLNLVNQMLDLSKLESGNLKLDLIQADIVSFLLYVAESFQSLAESKDIRLMAYAETDKLQMDYDEEKLKQVISNLLSNAVKFTTPNGKVVLHIAEVEAEKGDDLTKKLQIKIKDNGVGIPADKLPNIFDRFYQVDDSSIRKGEGTGIGLALTKELVKLMNGEISVSSEEGKGSEFKILLPITNKAPMVTKSYKREPAVLTESIPKESKIKESPAISLIDSNGDQPILLIIEDNPDVITYIKTCLEEEYTIEMATNGQEGIDKALELVPDIIISDVMMPEKDGYEVCAALKTDERTSHIPIVLLTAKATTEDKIAGLTQGADAYLTKPFNKEELLVRLEKLISLRKHLQERYSHFNFEKNNKESVPSKEALFLSKIHELVEGNISDDSFGIPQLCRGLGMSRSQIYRKLIALTGKSTSHYINYIRLHKAQELLKSSDLNVSEVAYDVGFTDPSYFTRLFTKEFGYPPSEVKD